MVIQVRQIGVEVEIEQVEVTLAGILPPYEASTHREFIPGLPRFHFVLEGERICELREDQAQAIVVALEKRRD